jgi:hypothetical protein
VHEYLLDFVEDYHMSDYAIMKKMIVFVATHLLPPGSSFCDVTLMHVATPCINNVNQHSRKRLSTTPQVGGSQMRIIEFSISSRLRKR